MADEINIFCEHTEQVDPKQLKPHPQNPNKHPASQIRMLAKSIKRFGWRHPIVVSERSGLIVAGHARRQAAIELKCQAPVDYQTFATEADEIAVLLADNILPELSDMDHQMFLISKEIVVNAEIPLDEIGIPELDVPNFSETDEDEQPNLDKKKMTICPDCGCEFET